MKASVYLFMFFACFPLNAQVFTTLDSLLRSVENLYALKLEASALEIQQSNKYRALNYLPSLGYDFLNHSPVLTYNISSLAGYLNNKQTQKIKVSAVEKGIVLALDQAQKLVTTHYLQLLDLFAAYNIEFEIYELNMKLYNLNLKKYENNEIPLEIFIPKQISIKEQEKNLYSMKEKIFHAVIALENLTNYQLNYEIKNFIPVSNTIIP